MAKSKPRTGAVSSPAATGGAGNVFEQHVGVHWLALLLVRGIPPILRDCTVAEVHFQTERLGWNTDDFLVVGQNGSGTLRKLLGQVKRSFTVSAADDDCKKAMRDSWKDFRNSQQFSPATDRLAIVTLRGSNTLLEHFAGLLDCARAAKDAADFEHRLTTPGFVHAKVVSYCKEIRTILDEAEGRAVSLSEVWPFLRVLHLISLDLATSTAQTEASVKTLLAFTTQEPDPRSAADATWDALLREVGEGMSQAKSYERDTLPEALRRRHAAVSGDDQHSLSALSEHSKLILDGIRSTLGQGVHLERATLAQAVMNQLESSQVIIVTGAAGSGKSAVAKSALGVLDDDHFVFCFRAEEFARPHLDETLVQGQIPSSAARLAAILAGQSRKVLLVESVERLLEASTRDAFSDLLTLVTRDKSWRLLLTCRDYSADLVRTSFLESAGVAHSVLTVPALDDTELSDVEAKCPAMARPLSSGPLRALLRNPYALDMAVRMPWPQDRPLPGSEQEFRSRFWQEVVRAEQRAAGGMPRRREQAFVEIALRRARALMLYAPCADLDPAVIDALRADSLVASPPQSRVLAAPAHDVLEDWAILQWIEEQYALHQASVADLSTALGTYPAVRRTFRKWVGELIERDAAAADALFQAVVGGGSLPAQFRDDTLVALLRSKNSTEFLTRHCETLFRDSKRLLRRIIHLLRVGCVRTPDWLGPTAEAASVFSVPDGPAWACVLRLVHQQLDSFDRSERLLLLGFIEDWARGVSWQSPYPEGIDSAAAIAHALLPHFDSYKADDLRKRTLQVVAKVPNGDRDRFAALLRGTQVEGGRDRAACDLQDMIFSEMDGMAAARDLPDVVMEVARRYFLYEESHLRERWSYGSSLGTEAVFGIKEARHHDFFPASAYRGIFMHLLRYHPRAGLDFLIELFNHSADWYAQRKVASQYVEAPFEITLTFADGTAQKQWCNARLWNLYRGTSAGPYALQSALMALESWLLAVAEVNADQLDATLVSIVRQSRSAALTAVVASVATAYPLASGEALLVLLSSPECVLLDRMRLAHESQAPSHLSKLMPQLNATRKFYDEERKQADARPHRRQDLEAAIIKLQFGPLAARVQASLDHRRTLLPPVERQDEQDRVWRLALHRMDLRRYTPREERAEDQPKADATQSGGGHRILFEPAAPEPDLQTMISQSTAQHEGMNARLGLLMWGVRVFNRETDASYDPAKWRERLQEAQAATTVPETGADRELGEGGPAFVAAVCIRDHWDELSADEQAWCAEVTCAWVERHCDNWNQHARVQRGGMDGDRPAAWVVSGLLTKSLPEASRERTLRSLVLALTHATDEVRHYAAAGVGTHLWGSDRELAIRCVNLLAHEASLIQQAFDAESGRPYPERRELDNIEAEVAGLVRDRFFESRGIPDDAVGTFDPAAWVASEAFLRILTILAHAPAEAVAIEAFGKLANTLVAWWDADDERKGRRERPHQIEPALSDVFERFLLRVPTATCATLVRPIVDAVGRHPREVSWVLRGLAGIEDTQPNTDRFWALWELFADAVRRAGWLPRIDGEHAVGGEMMSAVFLGLPWKDGVRHWRSLEGHAGRVHGLFEALPASSAVLDDYVRFLYHIGEQSLPEAFIRIAGQLSGNDPERLLRRRNTVFMLESLLRRYVYGRPLELKRQADLRNAVLRLLDTLVESGSSAAFRMRDDFVTPLSPE